MTAVGWSDRAAMVLATGFGVGYLRPAPGTWASLLAALVAWGLRPWGWMFWPLGVILLATAVWASDRAERLIGKKDPAQVVVDEMVGVFVAFGWLPASRGGWWGPLLAVALFRLFDVVKPGPLRRLQVLRGGWGIVADDVAAGLLAGLAARTVYALVARRCWLSI